ncbi:heterodisulfide reductase-related iron-sulfur binding cluster [Microlunatus sp. Gsoil 973]|uniref:heterodisulfide reductase-related iron-sulfur binding cluster n=1 Tax=Microlunatus sp. Gsoil 973 TaxID=2672569 RepID=UPI0012B4FD09|nr:heterodisulfide reductase-related iron-sulfur binding cluster [Microlunatus sp. Gsoil 973]QGN34381.1 4Fe-4S dicluster domain-containing protein [Microlunatus sp. Gsoil 973]
MSRPSDVFVSESILDRPRAVFDDHHPPQEELISDCVHCGFCLSSCPTYQLWGNEVDSPRGRIYLMKAGNEGTVELDDAFVQSFDNCLGCLACTTACPSGVQYDKLITEVRPQIERNYRRGFGDRIWRAMIFALFPHPERLRVAAIAGAVYQRTLRPVLARGGLLARLPKKLQAMEALLPPVRVGDITARLPERSSAIGQPRRRVGIVTGCAQQVFFHDVNEATVRVLVADGCDVFAPAAQGCCGALSEHVGREEVALDQARKLIDAFEPLGLDAIVTNVAGCGANIKQYGHLLRDDPAYAERASVFSAKCRDISELVDELGPVADRHPIKATVAYHDACHLAHGQQIRTQPRAALGTIPGLTVRDIPESEICCGSAGTYNLTNPEPAEKLGRRKVANIITTEPDLIATGNAGCLLQVRRYLAERDDAVPLYHPIQLIDFSIRGVQPPMDPPKKGAGQ